MKKYTQLPDELDLQGYPGSDFIIPFRLEGITGRVSMRTYQVIDKVSSELPETMRPVVDQAINALTGTITISGNQSAQYENKTCTHALLVNGTIYGAGDLVFSRVTDDAANTTEPLVLSAGANQSIVISPTGTISATLKSKPFDFRQGAGTNGQVLTHNFDCDFITSEAYNPDGTPNLDVRATPALSNTNVIDRNVAWLFAPGGFSGVVIIFPRYLTA